MRYISGTFLIQPLEVQQLECNAMEQNHSIPLHYIQPFWWQNETYTNAVRPEILILLINNWYLYQLMSMLNLYWAETETKRFVIYIIGCFSKSIPCSSCTSQFWTCTPYHLLYSIKLSGHWFSMYALFVYFPDHDIMSDMWSSCRKVWRPWG